ncbi:MAG TPA: hypothetical protein DF613_12855 [Lachnospiraceae bacterium]|nr:hypothetical protein [Lachnospiraceae bacterium]
MRTDGRVRNAEMHLRKVFLQAWPAARIEIRWYSGYPALCVCRGLFLIYTREHKDFPDSLALAGIYGQ